MRAVILPGAVLAVLVAACASGGTSAQVDGKRPDDKPADANGVFVEAIVDVRPELLRMPALEYPDSLRLAGVQGRVVVECIIDTLGRAEPASLKVVQSAHPMLDESALRVVREAEFRPGEVAGRRVRVLVRVPFNFTLRAPQ